MYSAHRLSLAQLSTMIGCVMGFHEKAGRSQGNSGFIVSSWFFSIKFLSRRVAAVAMLPSALSRSDLVARCMLGVLNSAGAAT